MIVILGRPLLDERGALAGLPARTAAASAGAGGNVELVGTVADDANGDAAVTELGRLGVGHAALLRTPEMARPLDAADVELALRYLADCRVVVIAEPLAGPAAHAAYEGAAYHGAHVLLTRGPGTAAIVADDVPQNATVLEQPDEDAGAFAQLVGRYAALLDAGAAAADAWREAISATGWEQAPA